MPRSTVSTLAAMAALSFAVTVEAHTNMLIPQVLFPNEFYNGNSPYGRINGDKFVSASSIPDFQGVQKIAKVMESYKTLREMIMANVNISTIDGHRGNKECGLTILTGPKQPLPDAIDFPWGHPGPCEAWCDNKRLFYNGNCQGNNVGKIPVDKTKCKGVSIIQAMYVGVHVSNWEVYANCAPMEGGTITDPTSLTDDASGDGATGGSSGGSATSGSSSAGTSDGSVGKDADGSSNSNATPSVTPGAPSTSSGSSSTTPMPATTAPTPSTKSKCNRRVRD